MENEKEFVLKLNKKQKEAISIVLHQGLNQLENQLIHSGFNEIECNNYFQKYNQVMPVICRLDGIKDEGGLRLSVLSNLAKDRGVDLVWGKEQ
jgi:hypothetical protein